MEGMLRTTLLIAAMLAATLGPGLPTAGAAGPPCFTFDALFVDATGAHEAEFCLLGQCSEQGTLHLLIRRPGGDDLRRVSVRFIDALGPCEILSMVLPVPFADAVENLDERVLLVRGGVAPGFEPPVQQPYAWALQGPFQEGFLYVDHAYVMGIELAVQRLP